MAWWNALMGVTLPEDALTMAEVRQGVIEGGREHHYKVAHHALPHLAFNNPVGLMGNLGDQEKLTELWHIVGSQLDSSVPRISADGFRAESRVYSPLAAQPALFSARTKVFSIALITFPLPRRATEAYFTAIVLGPIPQKRSNNNKAWIEETNKAPTRYFTLELGVNEAQTGLRTVFGEWRKDNTHVNYGDGPPPNLTAFYERVCLKIPKSV